MRRFILAAVLILAAVSARAQTGCSPQTTAQLLQALADNAPVGSITPQVLRNFVCSTLITPTATTTLSGANPGTFTNTQMNLPFTFLLNGINPPTEFAATQGGNFATQALIGGVAIPSTSTVSMAGGLGSYVNNASAVTNGVGLFINGRVLATGAQMFGINESLTDSGFASAALIANETDIECSNAGTSCVGYNMIGVFPGQSPGVFGYAYQASALGANFPWQVGFNCATGGAIICAGIAPVGSAHTSNSQSIQFDAIDGTGGNPVCGISETALSVGGNLKLVCQNGTINPASPLITFASAAGAAGFNLPPGTAPSSPNNGDVWATSAVLGARIGGATYNLLTPAANTLTGSTLAAGVTASSLTSTGTLVAGAIGAGFTGITGTPISGSTGAFSTLSGDKLATTANCSSSASPAVCGAAAAGSVAVPTGTNPTLVVNTTAVTANSQILLTSDESLGSKLSVTCNTTVTTQGPAIVTARTAATSFTVQIDATVGTNPVCLSYMIVN